MGSCCEKARVVARGFGGGFTEELKNPNPVSGADSPIPRGLFHPNATTLAPPHCARVSGILKLH